MLWNQWSYEQHILKIYQRKHGTLDIHRPNTNIPIRSYDWCHCTYLILWITGTGNIQLMIFSSFIKVIFQSLLVPVAWQLLILKELIVPMALEFSNFSVRACQRLHKASLFIKDKFLDLPLDSLSNELQPKNCSLELLWGPVFLWAPPITWIFLYLLTNGSCFFFF